MAQNSVKTIDLTIVNSVAIPAAYAAVADVVIEKALFYIRIVNDATTAITISYNGIDDHEYIAPNSFFELNAQANSQPNNQVCLFSVNSTVFIKGVAGVGSISISGYYV